MRQVDAVRKLAVMVGRNIQPEDVAMPMRDALAAHGIRTRECVAAIGEMRNIPTPALVELAGEGWAVIVKNKKHHVEIIIEDIPIKVDHATLWRQAGGAYLEVIERLHWGHGILGAIWRESVSNGWTPLKIIAMNFMAQGIGLMCAWRYAKLANVSSVSHLGRDILIVGGLGLVQVGLVFMSSRSSVILGQCVRYRLAIDLCARVLSVPFRVLAGHKSGDIGYAMAGARVFADAIATMMTTSAMVAMQCLFGITVAFVLAPSIGVVLTLFSVVIAILHLATARKRHSLMVKKSEAAAAQVSYLTESLRGAITVKTHGMEKDVVDGWCQKAWSEIEIDQEASRLAIWTEGAATFTTRLFIVLMLLSTAWLVIGERMGMAQMVFFVQLATSQAVALAGVMSFAPSAYANVLPRLEQIRSLIEGPEERPSVPSALPVKGLIEVENISFRYPESENWVIQGLSLRVEPMGRHWLKTRSGSGKTTLLRLISGLYEPQEGQILIDGQGPSVRGSEILYLPQNIRLFSGSIMNNLQVMSGGQDIARIVKVARDTGLDDYITALPMGYETIAVHGGANFSGGQQQWIAITAALASNKPIMLLDEAMANLDWQIRPRVSNSKYWENRTVVYASHDPFFV